ncbi:hypothetical protein [Kordiimonas sp. SCSIO 12610]|uniref:hypothetical protein n=1 Tax=Kordiimonas sp. SCSIO 12610 TaxID=2829597 RepID=UPI0021091CA6|nr:hypothetical protein [Kordiimonas sp. SCSIO 12610]UTW55340.1 hypothetical protein KFF44_00150 [Kordiimonas sp. SCSIO 12610]
MLQRYISASLLALILWSVPAQSHIFDTEEGLMKVQSITAVLPVERIEPSIEFFKKIGFTTDQEVPEGDHLGFVIVKQGETQLMYQTYSSIAEDVGGLGDIQKGAPSNIYIIVDNIDAVEQSLTDYTVTLERRKTFYGAEEIGYREPGGHLITFAEFASE